MTTRAELIEKLRNSAHQYLTTPDSQTTIWLTKAEVERIIDDLAFADFAHQSLESFDRDEVPHFLRKQAE